MTFFVVSQVVALAFFGQVPALRALLGAALTVAGAAVIVAGAAPVLPR